MKTKFFVFKTVSLLACASILFSSAAFAGEITSTQPISVAGSNLIDPITGAVSVGYDSKYIFRGTNLGKRAPWGSVDLSAPVGPFTVDGGAWYTNPTKPAGAILVDQNDELDLYVSMSTDIGPLNLALGYTAYLFPESSASAQNELGVSLGTSLWILDLAFAYYHNFDIAPLRRKNYFEWSAGSSFELTDRVGLSLGASLGHFETLFSNVLLFASLPVEVTDNLVVEPYIAGTIDGNDISGPGRADEFFFGASVNVSF